MAKERFLIIAVRMPDCCFSRFDEIANRAALDAGTADPNDAYGWIEASFEIRLVRYREATHICSFTPSAYYRWLANAFVGEPNAAWDHDGDPAGLEHESGGSFDGYGTYRDEYGPDFICNSFTIDTVKQLGLRKPSAGRSLSRRTDKQVATLDAYNNAIWDAAAEAASEIGSNGGFWCDALDVYSFRQREKARHSPKFVGDEARG